ncbi:MAG: GNAT family N-acetyltransferase [Actinocatenispora sp.]
MSEVTIQSIGPEDLPDVVEMVHELAAFEKAPESCHLTVPQLERALFAEHAALFGHVARARLDGGTTRAVGFALWFLNFSTWDGTHGIYLEDLYVRASERGSGLGRRLLATLAATCVERGYTRLQWSVLDWNPARDFYRAIGAEENLDWVPCRVTGVALTSLATGA